MDPAQAYVLTKSAVESDARSLDPHTPITATPGWDLRTLVAHVVGVAHDVGAGDVEEYSYPEWTARQVAARRSASVDDLLAEWDAVLPGFLEVLSDPSAHGYEEHLSLSPLVDLVSHHHDVGESIGRPIVVDPGVWNLLGPRRRLLLDAQIIAAGLPALQVRTGEGDEWTVGEGPIAGSVTGPRFDLWRSLEGRRTRAVVRSFDWTVDPEPYLDVWVAAVFDWPEDAS